MMKTDAGLAFFGQFAKAALDNIKSTGQSDHTAYMNKNLSHPRYRLYNLQRQQLFKVDPKYELIFKSQEGLYDKYKNSVIIFLILFVIACNNNPYPYI